MNVGSWTFENPKKSLKGEFSGTKLRQWYIS